MIEDSDKMEIAKTGPCGKAMLKSSEHVANALTVR